MSEKKTEKVSGLDVLTTLDVTFHNPVSDVYTARLPIAGCAWIDTGDGIVLIDTMISKAAARKVKEKITFLVRLPFK